MATIFTKIIDGDIPARMILDDNLCVAFLDVRPLAPGHVLVVPKSETDQWIDLPPETAAHLMERAHQIGNAQRTLFTPERIGLMIAGFEVPHTHLHVVPINSMRDLDFGQANTDPSAADLDEHRDALRTELSRQGVQGVVAR